MNSSGLEEHLRDETATLLMGERLALALTGQPGPLVVTLSGALGSGKTTLVRGLLRALGARGAIRSPSYTLVEEHAVPGWEVLHIDLYRLAEGESLRELGLRERHAPGALLLIEWPERAAAGGLPPVDLAIDLAIADSGHHLEARALSASGNKLLAALPPAERDE
jgi:tRNA threonylcarbamoyladenosine biosynthesis protein TsaE